MKPWMKWAIGLTVVGAGGFLAFDWFKRRPKRYWCVDAMGQKQEGGWYGGGSFQFENKQMAQEKASKLRDRPRGDRVFGPYLCHKGLSTSERERQRRLYEKLPIERKG